jgi:hypothetical protein
MKKNKKKPCVIAVDFDETLALYNPKTKLKTYIVKKIDSVPNPRIVRHIKNNREQGHKIVIWSSRWWGDYNAIVDWLKKYHIEVDDIVLGRFKADAYICDKSVNAHDPIMESLSFKLLNETESWGKWYKEYVGK